MGTAMVAADRLRGTVALDRAVRAALAAQVPQPAASADEVQGTRWRGASRTLRSLQSWIAPTGSATADLQRHELTTLRARSRDAMRNAPIARSALLRCRTSIVGTGLVCRPAVDHEALGITSDEAERISTTLRASWERWAEEPAECDAEAALDFYGLQALALLSAMASGDVFVLTPHERRLGGVSELKVQLVEADRVSNPHEAGDTPNCIDGIAISGATPVGCWIRNTHPGDRVDMRMAAWQYYPYFGGETGRRRVLHIWNDKERPGQVRGAPYLAPVLEPLKQLERYGDAELMAAVISAMFTVFIERDKELADSEGNPLGLFGTTDDQPSIALGNGAVVDLAPGEKASSQALNRPNVNFDPFFTAVVKQIGACLELPLDVLMLQFDRSYSAARAAMLEAWRFFNLRRWYLVQQFCQPLYALHIDEEVAAGRLVLPGYGDPIRRRAWTRALWIGPARGSMDEQKEAGAAKTRIEIGVSNEAMETAAMNGEDWNAVYAQRVREVTRRRADGLYAPVASPQPAASRADAEPPADDALPNPEDAA
ncbi:phage portal protein [Xanthomonas campestris pv. trichodesmae]|uniref:Phage portal protein n=2 Tax=Xanthomonas citri TaxID=346 RepID=A0AB33CI16_XANCI|nr:phage portal protein [Xanthomonas citri]ASK91864.1 phage portal protein [Xanthomonas citri pv. vignicola]MBV6780947.1 phage portal protein [Xanthomonas campestris pv. trichodesmae]MBZ3919214.1 portal protein [Xanthomonas campestris pv. trichodesmae]MBZ3922905.1 portal protein [Xanthomonas citri pv. sesbaniae]